MSNTRFPQMGTEIEILMRTLCAKKNWRMGYATEYIATQLGYSGDLVYRWRKGYQRPNDDVLVTLCTVGRDVAGLGRKWGEKLLNATQHTQAARILEEVWGGGGNDNFDDCAMDFPHNLPTRPYQHFKGPMHKLHRLLELLKTTYGASLIPVNGKEESEESLLILEAAYRCLHASICKSPMTLMFDAIVYINLHTAGEHPATKTNGCEAHGHLSEIIRQTATILQRRDILFGTSSEQIQRLYNALANQRTLLIVENLDGIADKTRVLDFLFSMPQGVKVIVSSTELSLHYSPIQLNNKADAEPMPLALQEHLKPIKESVTNAQFKLFPSQTSTMPMMIYVQHPLTVTNVVLQG